MATIDERLIECDGEPEIAENFNRVLGIIDANDESRLYRVRFDSDGGSSVADQIVISGEKAIEPTDPTKDGNVFAGWFLGEDEFDFSETEINGNIELVASWTTE